MSQVKTVGQSFNILGLAILAQVPATSADWDAIQGEGSCVQGAISEHGYRGYASPVRTAIIKALEEAGHKKEEGEKDAAFIKRLNDSGVDVEGIAGPAARAVEFTSTMTGASRADVGKDYLEQAQGVLAKWEAGTSTVEAFVTKMRSLVPSATVTDPTDVVAVARIIRSFRKKQQEDDLG